MKGLLNPKAKAPKAAAVKTERKRRADLIAAYHLGWRLSIGAALTKVLLLTPLLADGSSEASKVRPAPSATATPSQPSM